MTLRKAASAIAARSLRSSSEQRDSAARLLLAGCMARFLNFLFGKSKRIMKNYWIVFVLCLLCATGCATRPGTGTYGDFPRLIVNGNDISEQLPQYEEALEREKARQQAAREKKKAAGPIYATGLADGDYFWIDLEVDGDAYSGTVKVSSSEEIAPGASIIAYDSQRAMLATATADLDGRFRIDGGGAERLVFSYVGSKTMELETSMLQGAAAAD